MERSGTFKEELDSPARNSAVVTPHASNEVNTVEPRGLYVGGAGNITMRLVGDIADVVWTAVPAGTLLPVRVQYIRATGTTATNMVVVY